MVIEVAGGEKSAKDHGDRTTLVTVSSSEGDVTGQPPRKGKYCNSCMCYALVVVVLVIVVYTTVAIVQYGMSKKMEKAKKMACPPFGMPEEPNIDEVSCEVFLTLPRSRGPRKFQNVWEIVADKMEGCVEVSGKLGGGFKVNSGCIRNKIGMRVREIDTKDDKKKGNGLHGN